MVVYKVSGGVKDYLVTPSEMGAFKARSYLRARGIDAIVTKFTNEGSEWTRGSVR